MYTSTFIFSKRQFEDEFHALDAAIAATAKATAGYLGEECWENPATGLVSNVYYRESQEALQQLMHDPMHRMAKAGRAKWLHHYRVVISEVQREYGLKGLGIVSPAGGVDCQPTDRVVPLAQ